jgi:integrase
MASIQKRGKTYQYTVSHTINGKSKPIRKGGFRTKKEAQIASAEIEANLAKGIIPSLKPMPFDDYFYNWVKLYKSNLSQTTKLHYNYTYKAIKEYFGSKPLQEIKRNDYQLFLNRFGQGKSKETVEKVNIHIRSCILDALEEQIIQYDFTRKTVLTWTTPAKKPEEKHLNFGESELLAKELLERLDQGLGYYLLLLGLTSGMRFAEIVGLTIDDFDFENNTITINKTWGYMKRSPEGFGPTKNEQSNRIIRMNPKLMNEFKILFERLPQNPYRLVFYSQASKYKVISNTNANKLLRSTLDDLGIDPITVHGLRHTHASVLLYQEVTAPFVSKRLGHKDTETTYKKYAHLLDEMHEEEESKTIDIFEKMFK